MNTNLQAARRKYWDAIGKIRKQHNCDTAEAKRLYNQNGDASSDLKDLTPEALIELANCKVKEIAAQLVESTNGINALEQSLKRWQRISTSLDNTDYQDVARPENEMDVGAAHLRNSPVTTG